MYRNTVPSFPGRALAASPQRDAVIPGGVPACWRGNPESILNFDEGTMDSRVHTRKSRAARE
jgi:hypothetical protein